MIQLAMKIPVTTTGSQGWNRTTIITVCGAYYVQDKTHTGQKCQSWRMSLKVTKRRPQLSFYTNNLQSYRHVISTTLSPRLLYTRQFIFLASITYTDLVCRSTQRN